MHVIQARDYQCKSIPIWGDKREIRKLIFGLSWQLASIIQIASINLLIEFICEAYLVFNLFVFDQFLVLDVILLHKWTSLDLEPNHKPKKNFSCSINVKCKLKTKQLIQSWTYKRACHAPNAPLHLIITYPLLFSFRGGQHGQNCISCSRCRCHADTLDDP